MINPSNTSLTGIPAELTSLPQWLVWKYEQRANRPTKVPYNAISGKKASTTNPRTWTTFAEALEKFNRRRHEYAGLGFVFVSDDPFFGIDLDACRDPETGVLTTWAQRIVSLFDTYTEVSPSGTGVKLVGRGVLQPDRGNVHKLKDVPTYGTKSPEIAIYDHGRYWCMTGQRLENSPLTCQPRQEQLDTLRAQYFAPKQRSAASQRAAGSGPIPKIRDEAPGNLNSDQVIDDPNFTLLLAASATAQNGQRSERDFALCTYAVRHRLARESVWDRVEGVGKFAERGRDYFDRTWTNAEATVANDRTAVPTNLPASVHSSDTDLRLQSGRTDIANARRLSALHGQDIRYCDAWGKFALWEGKRWSVDHQRRIEGLAKEVSDRLWPEAVAIGAGLDTHTAIEIMKFCKRTADASGIACMIQMLKSEPGVCLLPDQLISSPGLLNCSNGTIDLHTGELRSHSRQDLILQLCPTEYPAAATCPLWLQTINTIFGGNSQLVSFVQRLLGYSLLGTVSEHILPILCGGGSNGKSLLVETVLEVLGPDYACKAAPGLLVSRRGEGHPTERADLFGKRLVVASETDQGSKLAEALVKELTGGDRIKARRMREDYWEFVPSHTVFLVTNHKPNISGTDHGIWRRVSLIPFFQTFWSRSRGETGPAELEAIPDLRERLRDEHPGILRWLVEGCLSWQEHGLNQPHEVTAATASYRAGQDVLAGFFDEKCTFEPCATVKASDVFKAYQAWCAIAGERPLTMRKLGEAITERGLRRRPSNGIWYDGMSLR